MAGYETGYGKPPESGKIRKGEVRNPNGRRGKLPASSLNELLTEAALLKAIDTEAVTIDGVEMTRREAHIRLQYNAGLKGKPAAIRFIDQLSQRAMSKETLSGSVHVPWEGQPLDEWNLRESFSRLQAQMREEAAAEKKASRRARARRGKPRKVRPNKVRYLPARPDEEVFIEIEEEKIEMNGRQMTRREMRLRALTALAAKGSRAAGIVIERLQKAGLDGQTSGGRVLLVPGPIPEDVWEMETERQQAKYRTQDYGKSGITDPNR